MRNQLKIFFIFIIFLCTFYNTKGALIDGAVAYWTHDNTEVDGSISEDIASGLNGTINGATTGASGIYGEAFSCDGTDDIDIAHNAAFASDEFTFSIWMYDTAWDNSKYLVFKDASGANEGDFALIQYSSPNNLIRFSAQNSVTGANTDTQTHMNLSTWHHIVAWTNGTLTKIYLNGVNEANNTIDWSFSSNNKVLYLCSWNGASGMSVTIDEVAFWNRTLTDAEITQLYNEGTPGEAQQYPFSGGSPPASSDHLAFVDIYNTTTTTSINGSFTTSGNYTNLTVYYNNSGTWEAIINTTDKNWTHNGLSNGTWYGYQLNITYNASIFNTSGILNIQTAQSTPDTTPPTLTQFFPSKTKFWLNANTSLGFDINCTDAGNLTYNWTKDGVQQATESNFTFEIDTKGDYNITGYCIDDANNKVSKYYNLTVFGEYDFTVVHWTDTQGIAVNQHSYLSDNLTLWMVEQKPYINIRSEFFTGDVVGTPTIATEWQTINDSIKYLFDAQHDQIYALGNHDGDNQYQTSRLYSYWKQYFGLDIMSAKVPSWGGCLDTNCTDSYLYFNGTLGNEFIILALDFCPSQAQVEWGQQVLLNNSDKRAIIATHLYMYHDDTTVDSTDDYRCELYSGVGSDFHNGDDLWNEFKNLSNVFMIASGHELGDGQGYLNSTGDNGNEIHQILSNYQDPIITCTVGNCQGWLNFHRYDPFADTITRYAYSPELDTVNTAHEFSMGYNLQEAPTTETLNITWNLINNGSYTQKNDEFFINFTGHCDGCSNALYDCYLEIDNVLNSSNLALNLTDGIYNYNFTVDFGQVEQSYFINLSCFLTVPGDDPDGNVEAQIYVDTINPLVQDLPSGDLWSNNNTAFYKNSDPDVLNFAVGFYDTNLYYYNHTIEYWGTDGLNFVSAINNTELYNTTNNENSNLYINLQTLQQGVYKVIGTAKDAHTAVNISKMDFFWLNDGSLYMEGVTFKPGFKQTTGRGDPATYFYYAGDRYKLKVTWEDKALEHSFVIQAPDWYYVGEKYGYKGHFVNVLLDRWLDFEGKNIKNVDVFDLGSDRFLITVHHFTITDEAEFESLGVLNTLSKTWTINVYDGFSFSAINPALDTLNNFTISVFNASGLIQEKTAVGQNVTFNITNGLYYTNISLAGYVSNSSDLINMTPGGSFQYTLFAQDTFYLLFYDEETLELINGTYISLDLISDSFSANYSTTDGSLTIEVTTPEDYTFRYQAAGYNPRISSYSLTNNSYETLSLYLLLNAANVSLYVYDQAAQTVEGAEIWIYRYSVATNSYILVNRVETDFTGTAVADMSLNSEFYKFFIYYNGDLKKQTQGAYITDTEITFQISLEEDVMTEFYSIQGITGSVAFNEGSGNFRFYYSDPEAAVSQGCLYLYKTSIGGETFFNSSCVSSPSSLILLNAPNITGQTYVAKGYVTIGGTDYIYGSASYTYQADEQLGNMGLFVVILFTILAGTIFLWDIAAGLIFLPLPMLIGSLPAIRWINIPMGYAVGVEFIMFILAFLIRRRGY